MNEILTKLMERLEFIQHLYTTAAKPFVRVAKRIASDDECASNWDNGIKAARYHKEWDTANACLLALGHASLGIAAKALHDYLRMFIGRTSGLEATIFPRDISQKEFSKLIERRNGSWLDRYCDFLLKKTTFQWKTCPVSSDRLEQIILCRNDFVHNPSWPWQSAEYHSKYPVPLFIAPLWPADSSIPAMLDVTEDQLRTALFDIRAFCEFVHTCSKL